MLNFLAEGVGFEPTSRFRETVFKTAAFNHSAIPPGFRWWYNLPETHNLQHLFSFKASHAYRTTCYQLLYRGCFKTL